MPQSNLASPALLNRPAAVLTAAIGAIRSWHDAAAPSARKLLVGVKLGEEVDVATTTRVATKATREHPTPRRQIQRRGPSGARAWREVCKRRATTASRRWTCGIAASELWEKIQICSFCLQSGWAALAA